MRSARTEAVRRWALALALVPAVAVADPLEDAQSLVLASSPLVAVAVEEVEAVARAEPWEVKSQIIHVNGKNTEISTAERERLSEVAQAKVRLETARQDVAREFLTEVQALTERRSKAVLAAEMVPFYRDQLTYHKQLEKDEQIEAKDLWEFAKQAQEAKLAARQAEAEYQTALDRTARQYGGNQWQKLKVLLAEYAKQTKP